MTVSVDYTIERTIIINGVDFEDITFNQINDMIDELTADIAALVASRADLRRLVEDKKANANG